MKVLEHEQHGYGGRPLGEQGERLLEHPQLGASGPKLQRRQGVDERLVGQLRADEIDRASEQNLEACLARVRRELGREPGLADPCFAGDERGRAASRLRLAERAPKRLELAGSSHERRWATHAPSIDLGTASPQDTHPRGHR